MNREKEIRVLNGWAVLPLTVALFAAGGCVGGGLRFLGGGGHRAARVAQFLPARPAP